MRVNDPFGFTKAINTEVINKLSDKEAKKVAEVLNKMDTRINGKCKRCKKYPVVTATGLCEYCAEASMMRM